MATKRRGVPTTGPPAAKRARCKEEEFNGARFKALLRDPATARKGEEGPGGGLRGIKACAAGPAAVQRD